MTERTHGGSPRAGRKARPIYLGAYLSLAANERFKEIADVEGKLLGTALTNTQVMELLIKSYPLERRRKELAREGREKGGGGEQEA